MRTGLTRLDAVIVLLCLILAACPLLALLRPATSRGILVVTDHARGTEQTYSLATDQAFDVSAGGHTLTVVIEGGSARVIASDCPDGICMASGAISRHGETLVCAPAGISLTVRGGKEGDADAIIG